MDVWVKYDLVADVAVLVSCCILVVLFGIQYIGTHRISFLFAPVVLFWLFCNSSIGVYNLVTFNPGIIRALSPYYIYQFFRLSGKDGWISLGGVLLCITGRSSLTLKSCDVLLCQLLQYCFMVSSYEY